MTYDAAAVEKASRDLLVAIGEDPEREGLIGTPDRMARAWREMCSGLFEDPREHLRTQFHAGTDELVLVRDITFHSVCEHHLLPCYGRAHVGYIPRGGDLRGQALLHLGAPRRRLCAAPPGAGAPDRADRRRH